MLIFVIIICYKNLNCKVWELANARLALTYFLLGKYDKHGYEIVFVYGATLQDSTNSISFNYLLNAILGYFYDLSEQIVLTDFVKDVRLVCILHKDPMTAKVNFLYFTGWYLSITL